MPEPILWIIRIAFLGVLYLFVFYALRALVRESRSARDSEGSRAAGGGGIGKNRGGNPGSVWLVESPGQRPRSLALMPELSVGRSTGCDLPLPDDTFISQYHARFALRDGACFVEDLGSTNGTYLNGTRLTQPMRVEKGDRVSLGKTVLELRK